MPRTLDARGPGGRAHTVGVCDAAGALRASCCVGGPATEGVMHNHTARARGGQRAPAYEGRADPTVGLRAPARTPDVARTLRIWTPEGEPSRCAGGAPRASVGGA